MTAGDVILVTGGAGFLGKHIVRLLQEKATDVKEIRIFDTKPFVNDIGISEQRLTFLYNLRSLEFACPSLTQ